MNASAIYSKSGKGVQEASGKTSHLSRSDRAVLAAIDGRATLSDVAQKVGKTFDAAFEKLIESLDKGGFIREVSAGSAAPAKPGAAPGKPAGKPTAPMDAASDLDFTTALQIPKGKPAAPKPAAPPPPPPPSPAEKAQAAKSAQEQQDAFAKAREEAERKAAAERERVKAEAEAKMRAETEAKLRAETEARLKAEAEAKAKAAEAKAKAEAEAKVKAAQAAAAKAAAEAKAKAEEEARRAREEAERVRAEAERVRKEAEEKARREAAEAAERARREAEEKARREQEELRRKLEEERKAREEAERRAREEAQRLEEERRKLEAERKAHEEARRKEEEERAMRRIQEERERADRRRGEQEEAARRKAKAQEEISLPELNVPTPPPAPKPTPAPAAGGGSFSDSLLADLDSFKTNEEEEAREREEAARKEREAAAARAREEAERRAKEEAERSAKEERQRRKQEEAERKAREEAELRAAEEREKERLKEEEEKRKAEAEERAKKAKAEEQLAVKATRSAVFDAEQRAKRERELMSRGSRVSAAAHREKKGWGKPIAITLFLLLVVALGVLHIMPIDTLEYERAATDALGRPVKIGSARVSLFTGLLVKLNDVAIGDNVRIAEVRAYPEFDALTGPRKAFSRIEIERMKVDQESAGSALFARVKADNFSVGRIVAKNFELTGPLALPKGLEIEVVYDAEGMVRTAVIRGPEALYAQLTPKGKATEVEMTASSFAMPFAPEITLNKFSMKGSATPQGLQVSEWDGALLNGTVSGTANVRWGDSWTVDGVLTARNLYAAVFAPALISDGRAEGSGKFLMRGEPGKLASAARLDGSFTVTRGVLGSIDLSRAIQTQGKFATGRTQFNEMNGQATYDRGAVSLRNVTLSAGQLNAGASADIAENGALSGRIVADVRVASQNLRATLHLGGTVKEPQVRN
ncbi:MAG TPA: hypothetical protein VF280_17460 [Burkholderiales bacterium]